MNVHNLDPYTLAQDSVIGSMLIDDRCVPLVMSKLTEDDFLDPTCRNFFRVIRELVAEGRTVDLVPIMGKLKDQGDYVRFARDLMDATPTAANVGEYIPEVQKGAMMRRFWGLCSQGAQCVDLEDAERLARKMVSVFSATDRMPRMTGPQLSVDFLERMRSDKKPEYLPWGVPTADRTVFAELGDMILLGGYASSGKTLLSILMAMTQAKRAYKVGYYSLETRPEKMADRMFASLTKVPMNRIKARNFSGNDWAKFAQAANFVANECPFDIIRAAGSTVDDVISDAIGHGYQIIYIDYVQLLRAPGVRDTDGYSRITVASQALKTFSQNTNTAVVALAQLTRPPGTDSKRKNEEEPEMPTMHSLKGSGQLEQDADAVFLVFPFDRKDNKSARVFRIAKNKDGERPGPILLAFDGSTQTMAEAGSDGITMDGWADMDQMALAAGGEDNPFA